MTTITNIAERAALDALGRVVPFLGPRPFRPWYASLQRASIGGVPFGVRQADMRVGRKTVMHEYPYRDKPWNEDLGRAARKISITGFLITNSLIYGGGDVLAQRARLAGVCETQGPLTLIHPTLGRMAVSLQHDDGFTITERWDSGRFFEFTLHLVEDGALQFPVSQVATGSLVSTAAAALDTAAAGDFSDVMASVLPLGQSVINQVVATSGSFGVMLTGAIADASGVAGLLGKLQGNFGLYAGGANLNVLGNPITIPGVTANIATRALQAVAAPTVQSLTSIAAAARQSVAEAVGSLARAAVVI